MYRAFDVELLYIAQQLGMPIKEVPVNWQEIDGEFVETAAHSIDLVCAFRFKVGTILELVTDGKRYTVHSTSLSVWYMDTSQLHQGKD